jgi:hypothetical protein
MRGTAVLLATCALVAIGAAQIAQVTTHNAPFWAITRDASAAQMAAFALLCLWIAFLLFVVRPVRVWDAGAAYAERLLASLSLRHPQS